MQKIINEDYSFIKGVYDNNYNSFDKYLQDIKKIHGFEEIWSDSYFDIYHYQSVMNQQKEIKIYKKEPSKTEGVIKSRIKNQEPFYSYQINNENNSGLFILKDGSNKMSLLYSNDTEDEAIVLSQLYYVFTDKTNIKKVIFYMNDYETGEETCMIDVYEYYDNILYKIYRNGFYENKNKELSPRTFRFDYTDDKLSIYSKQKKIDGNELENKIFPA